MAPSCSALPFDPKGEVVVSFRNRAQAITFTGGLECERHGIWRAPEVKGIRLNDRGVPIINEAGEIQQPWGARADNSPSERGKPQQPTAPRREGPPVQQEELAW